MAHTNEQDLVQLACDLIAAPSVSPDDAGCQVMLADRLEALGFTVEPMPFEDVSNFWAVRHGGAEGPLVVFAGHTDVVPPGPLETWHPHPFEPEVIDGMLCGRGAADMKGSLAAMVKAVEAFVSATPEYKGSIGFLITSDEEADAINGTVRVVDTLNLRGTRIDMCIVGEPSSASKLGDVVRVGRRGSLNARLRVIGQQGHVAYPDKASNPIHNALKALAALCDTTWDNGNEFFPPTTMQISNVHAGTGVNNVIPGDMVLDFNFRFSTESGAKDLQERTTALLDEHDLDYELEWSLSGNPFLTSGGKLIPAVVASLEHVTGIKPELSTSGGTSDGRFIAPTGTEVVELGPINETIHKINERVCVDDLVTLRNVYADILARLLAATS